MIGLEEVILDDFLLVVADFDFVGLRALKSSFEFGVGEEVFGLSLSLFEGGDDALGEGVPILIEGEDFVFALFEFHG